MDEVVLRFDLGLLGADEPAELLEAGPPVQRGRRRRWRLLVVGVLVAAVAVWFVPESRSSSEARWLATVWATRAAYDDARAAALAVVLTRAVPGDESLVARGVAAVDAEEATAVARLAGRVRARRLLSHEVRRARTPVVTALRAQTAALRLAAAAAPRTAANVASFPSPLEGADAFVHHADDVMRALARRHRLTQPKVSVARFGSADPVIASLTPLADVRTGLRVVVTTDTGTGGAETRLLDLDNGTSRGLASVTAGYDITVLPDRVVSTSGTGVTTVVQLTPGAPQRVVRAPLLAATRDGLWLAASSDAVRFDPFDAGRAAREYPVPDGFRTWAPYPAQGQLFLTRSGATWLWDPRRGLVRALSPGCADVLAANERAVAWTPCTDHARVDVLDLATQRTEAHAMPGRLEADAAALSASGQVEVHGAAPGVQDGDGICWSELRSSALRCVGTYDGTTATSWSGDSRWLLVARRSVIETQLLLLDTRTAIFHRLRLHSMGPMSAVIVP